MHPLIKKFAYIVYILLLTSCGHYPKEVEKALLSAGNNRENLIAVLEHYKSKDSEKYAAACFLIANMPYHKSDVSLSIPSTYSHYFSKIDSIYQVNPNININDSIQQILAAEYATLLPPKTTIGQKDIEILTKDFLILNIDAAFEEWHHSPLLRNLSFDEFKEWILPYRTVNEALVYDKMDLRKMMYNNLSHDGMDNIRKPIELYKKYVRLQKSLNKRINTNTHIGTYDLFLPTFKMDCHNLATITCNIFRACGIPVVYEFTPQWIDKDSRHYWCSSPDSTFTFQPYTPPYNNLGEDWELSLKYASKVYRMTFGVQKDTPYFLKTEKEEIPAVFNKATIMDVTPNYHVCTDISLPAPPIKGNNLAYLSLFNTQGLNPVAWGSIDSIKQVVHYHKIPINTLFFPTYIDNNGKSIQFDMAFMIRQDSTTGKFHKETINCNHQKRISIHLLRKYPPKPHLENYRNNIKGALLLATNKIEDPYDTLYVLPTPPAPYWQKYKIDNNKEYRYYKLQTKDKSSINIAEYEFLATKDSKHIYTLPSTLPIFDSLQCYAPAINPYMKVKGAPIKSGPLYLQACDGNLDSYIESSWFGIEFAPPVCVRALQLYPRNARNGIEPNNNYQLLYFDKNKWIEHETACSRYNYIDFDSVPSGTIYWLRNLDHGKEELPFFFRKGKQIFISQETW
nr:hypothetical protein [Bacteroides intestinalis]